MILYDHPLSSYAQKVKIALREKGVAFERALPEGFGTGRQDTAFAAANPRTEVPVLLDGDAAIFDSTIILEYIEETWPDPPLLPSGPTDRAAARQIEEICDSQYEAVNWGFGELLWFKRASGALEDRLRAAAIRDTARLQLWLEEQLGDKTWFGGDRFGWADAAAAPMINRSVHYGLGPRAGAPLANWHARLRDRPAVAETFAEFDAATEAMTAVADYYRTGGRRREYRDHRLEWMIRSGGIDVVQEGLRQDNIRFSWPAGPP
jgi:RNA polymerase-associated protein